MAESAALRQLGEAQNRFANFGASDSEGYHAVERVERAIEQGKAFPLTGHNPFDLYQSMPGWEAASAELVTISKAYWISAMEAKLGIKITVD